MTLNPILKVLSVMRMHRVRFLLMGGQACVFYGAAEFSRDTDVTVLAEEENLVRLREALDDLKAEEIAVPPLSLDYLLRGHAVHFRCRDTEAAGLRVDVMSLMRGLPPFPELWDRRTTVELENGEQIDLLGPPSQGIGNPLTSETIPVRSFIRHHFDSRGKRWFVSNNLPFHPRLPPEEQNRDSRRYLRSRRKAFHTCSTVIHGDTLRRSFLAICRRKA